MQKGMYIFMRNRNTLLYQYLIALDIKIRIYLLIQYLTCILVTAGKLKDIPKFIYL